MDKSNRKKLPEYVMKFRTDGFVAFSYALVAAMLVLQVALIVWAYFM